MTNTLFAQVVPLLVAMAVPVAMIKAIRYLLAGRPVAHSLLMILTWGTTFFPGFESRRFTKKLSNRFT